MRLPVDIQFIKDECAELIQNGDFNELTRATLAILKFKRTIHVSKAGKPLELKNRRLQEWDPTEPDIEDIIFMIFGSIMAQGTMTMQAVCGMLNHIIKVEDLIDRVHILSSCIALVSKSGLIDINKSESGYHMISTEFALEGIPDIDRHGTAFNRPQLVENNYDPEQGSMLLGGKMNLHDYDICLDHINKLNSVPMALNWEFLCLFDEEPKDSYYKDADPAWKTQQKKVMWELQQEQAKEKYIEMKSSKGGNKCFPNHKYCTRGRTYQVGYFINAQGSSFKKASLELYHKEKLNNAF